MPTVFDRYLTRRILATFLKVVAALVLVVILVDFMATRRQEIMKYEVPWTVVFEYYLVFIPAVLFKYQAAAMSMLVAGLVVFGRAAQDNEATALLAGGVGVRRIARYPVLLAAVLSVAVFLLADSLGAPAYRRYHALELQYFDRVSPDTRTGVSWTNLSGEWTVHVSKFNRIALTGEGVTIHDVDARRVRHIRAGRIFWDPTRAAWLLEDGLWFVFDRESGQEHTERITQAPAPFTESPGVLFALDTPADAKSAAELRRDLTHARRMHAAPLQRHWVDYYVKFAQPALVLVMMLLAIPFAMRVRRGGVAIGFGIAVAVGMIYVFVFAVFTGLGHLRELPPLVAAWGANVLFLIAACYFLRKTPT
ncbi:MAG: LptF/LptG family permease [Candidatus Hydrogenedentota bacterium]